MKTNFEEDKNNNYTVVKVLKFNAQETSDLIGKALKEYFMKRGLTATKYNVTAHTSHPIIIGGSEVSIADADATFNDKVAQLIDDLNTPNPLGD